MKLFIAVLCLTSVLSTANAYHAKTKSSHRELSITIPPECVGQELCLEKPIDYPSEEIDIVARRLTKRLKRHNEEYDRFRSADSEDHRNNCAVTQKMIQPFLFIHNETANFVIQSDSFTQTLQSVFCKNTGARCLEDFTLLNFKPKCTNAFSLFKLFVLEPKNAKVKTVETSVPVDCKCSLMDD